MVPRIALIGAGRFGEMHLRAFFQMQRDRRLEWAGIADVDRDLLAKRSTQYAAPEFADYRDMLAGAKLEAGPSPRRTTCTATSRSHACVRVSTCWWRSRSTQPRRAAAN